MFNSTSTRTLPLNWLLDPETGLLFKKRLNTMKTAIHAHAFSQALLFAVESANSSHENWRANVRILKFKQVASQSTYKSTRQDKVHMKPSYVL
jgi:hypothetical protein